MGRKKRLSVGPFVSNGAYCALVKLTDNSSQSFTSTSSGVNTKYTLNIVTMGLGTFYNDTRVVFDGKGEFNKFYLGGTGFIGFKIKSK